MQMALSLVFTPPHHFSKFSQRSMKHFLLREKKEFSLWSVSKNLAVFAPSFKSVFQTLGRVSHVTPALPWHIYLCLNSRSEMSTTVNSILSRGFSLNIESFKSLHLPAETVALPWLALSRHPSLHKLVPYWPQGTLQLLPSVVEMWKSLGLLSVVNICCWCVRMTQKLNILSSTDQMYCHQQTKCTITNRPNVLSPTTDQMCHH